MLAAMRQMVVNALRETTLGNLVKGLSYAEACDVVTYFFGPNSEERAEVDRIYNVT